MKLPYDCGERIGRFDKLGRVFYGIKQVGRQWSAVICHTLADEHGMKQCRADPYMYRNIVEGVVELILVVHVNDILVSGKKETCDELHHTLNDNFPFETRGVEVVSGVRCAARLATGQCNNKPPAMIDTLTKRFNLNAQSDTIASTGAEPGPTTVDDTVVVDCPFRQAVGSVMSLAGMTRPGIAIAARRVVAPQSHSPCERHWKAATKILAYLNSTRDLEMTYTTQEELSLLVYTDADYASKDTDRRSISGVAVMLGNAEESHTALRDVLYDRGRERSACQWGQEGVFVRPVMSFMQPNVYEITLMEENERTKAMAENLLSSHRSKQIDVRWHFIREVVGKKELNVVHVASEWQHADIITKALHITLFKRHRKALLNLLAEE